MSDLTTIARPYASAAFEYACEQNTLSEWSEQLALLSVIAADAQVNQLLDSPAFTREQRGEILLKIGKGKLTQPVENLVKLLAENDRLAAIGDIHVQFEVLKAEHEGTIEATVLSAQALPEAQQKKIIASLEKRLNKKIELKCEIDESLIGGAIIKAGDLVIDGSVKTRLGKLTNAVLR